MTSCQAATGHLFHSKRRENVGSVEVGRGGRREGLQLGLAPTEVARLLGAEIVKVIDLAFDDGTPLELGLDRGPLLVCPGLDQACLVNIQSDRAYALCDMCGWWFEL